MQWTAAAEINTMTPSNGADSDSESTDTDSSDQGLLPLGAGDRPTGVEARSYMQLLFGQLAIEKQRISNGLHSVPTRAGQVSKNTLRLGLLLVLTSIPVAAQGEFCDSAFGELLVATEGLVTSISVSVIVIMVVVGALAWVAGRIIPGGGAVGAIIIVLAILSFFAMTFGISFLGFAIDTVGYEHCSTIVE